MRFNQKEMNNLFGLDSKNKEIIFGLHVKRNKVGLFGFRLKRNRLRRVVWRANTPLGRIEIIGSIANIVYKS